MQFKHQKILDNFWLMNILSIMYLVMGLNSSVLAQITIDNTTPTILTGNCNNSCNITGGINAGNVNLFHSFTNFNVNSGSRVSFVDPEVTNIITRVTGNNVSNINGILAVTNGNANLYLMNPNGIIFGNNARLDLNGSFLATTANGMGFGNLGKFNATPTAGENLSLLSINPNVFFFNQLNTNQGLNSIQLNQGALLEVPQGKNIVLLGGNSSPNANQTGRILIDGSILKASGGRIEIATVGESGNVGINHNFQLNVPSNLTMADILITNNSAINVNEIGSGNINIYGRNITLTNNSKITADTLGNETGGNININTLQLNINNNSFISVSTLAGSNGQAGNLNINADTVNIIGNGEMAEILQKILSKTDLYEANDRANGLFTANYGTGNAGNLTLNINNLNLVKEAIITSSSFGNQGLSGHLTINANEDIFINNGGILTGTRSKFDAAGDLLINANNLKLINGGIIATTTLNDGTGGNLTLNINDTLEVTGTSQNPYLLSIYNQPQTVPSSILTATFGTGNSGDLMINTGQLIINNNGLVTTSTLANGDGGDLQIKASELIQLSGNGDLFGKLSRILENKFMADDVRDGIFTASFGSGNTGILSLETNQLTSQNGALISASTFGKGQGEDIIINAIDSVNISESGLITGTTNIGKSGNLTINTQRLNAIQGSIIATSTLGSGQSGDLIINATKSVEIFGSPLEQIVVTEFSDGSEFALGMSVLFTQSIGSGIGGDLMINTQKLIVGKAVQISTGSLGNGEGGDLIVNAEELVEIQGGATIEIEFAEGLLTSNIGSGNAGDLTINTNRLFVKNAQVRTETNGSGNGGNLNINAESIELIGNLILDDRIGLLAGALSTRPTQPETIIGNAGNITVNTENLIIEDGATISVKNEGNGIAGNIKINANTIFLDHSASITAETLSANGGNIFLTADQYILMRHGSNISATAGINSGSGDGGNITINTPFIIAVPGEDNNITANAFQGHGGNIYITTSGIFGLELTQENIAIRNDITVSSQFGLDGQIEINTPDLDPTSSFVTLPSETTQPSQQIVVGCNGNVAYVGTGGVSATPSEPFNSNVFWTDFRPLTSQKPPQNNDFLPIPVIVDQPSNSHREIRQAQGWIIDTQGQVILTAQAPHITPHNSGIPVIDCNGNVISVNDFSR